ncbi:zinc ribbon domain-containing protein [Gammaproteobacteria bacterium]|nr:zinc ribbon domain-containing protein [Gammaproteobacteria bacterium]
MSVGPPALRSPQGIKLDEHVVEDELTLQQCGVCQTVQYPPRELCCHCLGDELNWSAVSRGGELLAYSELQHSLEPFFQEQLPWRLASVKLDCGPVVLARLTAGCSPGSKRLEVSQTTLAGSSILQASPANIVNKT